MANGGRCAQRAPQNSLGRLQHLSSPLLAKLEHAVSHIDKVLNNETISRGQTVYVSGRCVGNQGDPRAAWGHCAVTWDNSTCSLSLCFKTFHRTLESITPEEVTAAMAGFQREPAIAPAWLAHVAPAARVGIPTMVMFEGQREDLHASILSLTGGLTPRRIECMGWCLAGSVSMLAATWAALQFPTADKRCITFGAIKIGNATFAQTFRWLVGLNYRVVYHRDPAPVHKAKEHRFAHRRAHVSDLVHVHGQIFIGKEHVHAVTRHYSAEGIHGSHDWERYAKAVRDLCRAQPEVACEALRDRCTRLLPARSESLNHRLEESCAFPAAQCSSQQQDHVQYLACQSISRACSSQSEDMPDMSPPEMYFEDLQQHCSKSSFAQTDHTSDLSEAAAMLEATAQTDECAHLSGSGRDSCDSCDSSRSAFVDAPLGSDVQVVEGLLRLPPARHSIDEHDSMSLDQVLLAGKINQAAALSAAAYEDEERFQLATGICKTRLVIDKRKRNTHVHVGWLDEGTAVLAFRGTATMQDGLADVKFMYRDVAYLQQHFPGSRAHLGFVKQFVGVCKPHHPNRDLAAVVNELSAGQAPTRVLCCGHSLGGALATLGAAWAALQWPQADVRCITFGSPRVGNQAFRQAFHSLVGTSFRLVNGRDPVPALPPSGLYCHVHGAIHIRPDGSLALRPRSWQQRYPPNLSNHGMLQYRTSLTARLPNMLCSLPMLALGTFTNKAKADLTETLEGRGSPGADAPDCGTALDEQTNPSNCIAKSRSGLTLRSIRKLLV